MGILSGDTARDAGPALRIAGTPRHTTRQSKDDSHMTITVNLWAVAVCADLYTGVWAQDAGTDSRVADARPSPP